MTEKTVVLLKLAMKLSIKIEDLVKTLWIGSVFKHTLSLKLHCEFHIEESQVFILLTMRINDMH